MSRFSVSGAELDIDITGETGIPVVQLHGLTSSKGQDRLDLAHDVEGARVLRYDARGHGQSTGRTEPEDYRWESLADDLLRILDQYFPGERVYGVGTSMGTGTLLHAALVDRNRFFGLTLSAPPTAWETRAGQVDTYRGSADLIESQGIEPFLAMAKDAPRPPALADYPFTEPGVPEFVFPSVLRGAALTDLPDREDIAQITIPATILAWSDDPGHPLSTAESLASIMPSATLSVAHNPAERDAWRGIVSESVARAAN